MPSKLKCCHSMAAFVYPAGSQKGGGGGDERWDTLKEGKPVFMFLRGQRPSAVIALTFSFISAKSSI